MDWIRFAEGENVGKGRENKHQTMKKHLGIYIELESGHSPTIRLWTRKAKNFANLEDSIASVPSLDG